MINRTSKVTISVSLLATMALTFTIASAQVDDWRKYFGPFVARHKNSTVGPTGMIHNISRFHPSYSRDEIFLDFNKGTGKVSWLKTCRPETCRLKITIADGAVKLAYPSNGIDAEFVGKEIPIKINSRKISKSVDELAIVQIANTDLSLSGVVNHSAKFLGFFIKDRRLTPEQQQKKAVSFWKYDPSFHTKGRIEMLVSKEEIIKSSNSKPKDLARVRFRLNGEDHTLTIKSVSRSGDIVAYRFSDNTSGITTYSGGRILEDQLRKPLADFKTGEVVEIDFNFATFPPCYYSSVFKCPLPYDNVATAVTAGERFGGRTIQ